MRDSIQRASSPTLALLVVLAPYAVYHDSIKPRGGDLPRRGILTGRDGGLGKKDVESIEKLLDEYINGRQLPLT
jgi:hypothetical protein